MSESPGRLPIDDVLPAVLASLGAGRNVCVRAPTGAGKTTRIAPALLDAGQGGGKRIVLCEPRRLAARATAGRIAKTRGGEVGGETGYHVRFDRRVSRNTKILVVTEGILTRMLQEDPFLEDIGIVIFDEFHERNLDADLGIAMTRKLQSEVRADLGIVVMSATVAMPRIVQFLDPCDAVESTGRQYPVEISYVPRRSDDPVPGACAAAIARAASSTPGHILAFLPGLAEIRRTRESLEGQRALSNWNILELYGEMPADLQDAVLSPSPERKIILATNVAETSVTIEGVTAVVDTGLRKLLYFDPATGLDRLETVKISKSSATQRAGRAGRTAPGICYRLWSEPEQRTLPDEDAPEVARVDLASAFLQLKAWGEREPRQFSWFEAPPPASLDRAEELNHFLEAIDGGGALTTTGAAMAGVPAHPRIAKLLMEAVRWNAPREGALAAALLSERDPFRYESQRARQVDLKHWSPSDVLDRIHALSQYEQKGMQHSDAGTLHASGARSVLRARDQYLQIAERIASDAGNAGAANATIPVTSDEAVMRSLFAAYADRLARRREPGSRRAVLAGGRGAKLADSSAVAEPELFVCMDMDGAGAGADALVRLASAVERDWIPEKFLVTREELQFSEASRRVAAMRRVYYQKLVLSEVPCNPQDPVAAARVLAEAARKSPEAAFDFSDAELTGFLERVACLREWCPEPALPDLEITSFIEELCTNRESFAELKKINILEFLQSKLDYKQLQWLDREAPKALQVPSGSFIHVKYERRRPPVLAVRIQEIFGMNETPRIARGRVPVLLHLLAPNYRPQQITTDLASFWSRTYPQIRKELRARYPRHAWPEDPTTAIAERRPKPRT